MNDSKMLTQSKVVTFLDFTDKTNIVHRAQLNDFGALRPIGVSLRKRRLRITAQLSTPSLSLGERR